MLSTTIQTKSFFFPPFSFFRLQHAILEDRSDFRVERFGLKFEVEAEGVEDFGEGFFENLFFEESSFFEVEGVESLVFLVDRILS